MDNSFQTLGFRGEICSLNSFGILNKVQSGVDHCMDTTLRLETIGASGFYCSSSNGTKRKRGVIDGTKGTFSLDLGLGHSPSSSDDSKMTFATACALSSVKEADEGISIDMGLNVQLSLGSESTSSAKKPSLVAMKTLEIEPSCDLQLSLSAVPSTSVITIASPPSINNQNLEISVSVDALPLVDEGSTSSRWKSGVSSLPPFHAKQTANSFHINWAGPIKVDSAPVVPNLLSTTIPTVTCTSGITHTQQHRNTSTKTCQFQGCGKGARGASGLCIAHGGGRRCHREGCHKGAEGRTLYCKAHGGGRRCQYVGGCTKSAEGRTDFCIAHGGGRRCSYEGCTRAARGKSGLCIRHGGGKRCKRENCTKSAEGYSGLCISHGGGRRCQAPECTKGAQGSTQFCKAHGGGKRCTVRGCTKGAEGSTPFCKGHGGGKRCSFQGGGVCPKSVHGGTRFCVAHGGGKRCAAPECTKSARGRTDFCVRHGGGKRCKSEGCGKSAQGRTDFCKAHGGGKRCSWGQAGSGLGAGGPPCDRFARGKTGLCTAHSTLVQDHVVNGGGALGSDASQKLQLSTPEKMKQLAVDNAFTKIGNCSFNFVPGWNAFHSRPVHQISTLQSGVASLPEGRVHGGSLMAMLASGAGIGSHTGSHAGATPSMQGATHAMPPKWM